MDMFSFLLAGHLVMELLGRMVTNHFPKQLHKPLVGSEECSGFIRMFLHVNDYFIIWFSLNEFPKLLLAMDLLGWRVDIHGIW